MNNEKSKIKLKPALKLAYQQPLNITIDNTVSAIIHALAPDGKLIASSPVSEKKISKSAYAIASPIKDILQQRPQSIQSYRLYSAPKLFMVAFVGDTKVGKTSLINLLSG